MIANQTPPRPNEENNNESPPDSLEANSRTNELHSIVRNLREDNDLLITGVPGSGRYTLVKRAAKETRAKLIEVDCIKATSGIDFVNLLIKGIYKAFGKNYEDIITQKLHNILEDRELFKLCQVGNISVIQLLSKIDIDKVDKTLPWKMFEFVVQLPGQIIENPDERVVVVLKQISHLRSWDREKNFKHKWEKHLRDKLNQDPKVSYVILETIAELEELEIKDDNEKVFYKDKLFSNAPIKVMELKPLSDNALLYLVEQILDKSNLTFGKKACGKKAREKVLNSVQGHIDSAETLIKRLLLICKPRTEIDEDQVQDALNSLLKDLSPVFESLLLMLPASQLQLIECLAIEPSPKPHSKEYIDKYGLARGGTLQGAIKGLQQKGLIYGSEDNFQLTLPLFAIWIKNNLYETC